MIGLYQKAKAREYIMKTYNQDRPAYIQAFVKEPPLLLKNFPYDEMLEFLSLGVEKRFLEDEVIINGDEYVSTAFLVADGKVTIVKKNVPIIELTMGDFLGETFLFSKYTRIAKVVSAGDSRLLRFTRSDTLDFFKRKPKKLFHIFARNVITIQQVKLKKMNVQLLQLKKRLAEKSGNK